MGLNSDKLAETIQQNLTGDINGIRTSIMTASLLGKSLDEVMKEMIDSPLRYAADQQLAFEKLTANFDPNNWAQVQAMMKLGKEQFNMSEEQLLKTIAYKRQNKSLGDELLKQAEEARKKEEEYVKSGRKGLDEAFKTQISSFSAGWEKLKSGISALWASSLRPVLGAILGGLGKVMGALGTAIQTISQSKIASFILVAAGAVTTFVGAVGLLLKPVFLLKSALKSIEGFTAGKGLMGKISEKVSGVLGGGGGAKGVISSAFADPSKTGKFAAGSLKSLVKAEESARKFGGIFGKVGKVFEKITGLLNKLPFGTLAKSGGKLGGVLKFLPKLLGKLAFFIEPIMMLFDFFTTKGDISSKIGVMLTGSKKGGIGGAISGALRWASIGALIGSIVPGVGTAIGGVVGLIFGTILGGIGSANIGSFLKKYSARLILSSLLGVLTGGIGAPIGWWLGGMLEGESGKNAMGNMGDFFKGMMQPIKTVFKDLGTTFKTLWTSLKTLWDVFSQVFDTIFGALGAIVGGSGGGGGAGSIARNKDGFTKLGKFFGTLLTLASPLILLLKGLAITLLSFSNGLLVAAYALSYLPGGGGKKKRAELKAQMESNQASIRSMVTGGEAASTGASVSGGGSSPSGASSGTPSGGASGGGSTGGGKSNEPTTTGEKYSGPVTYDALSQFFYQKSSGILPKYWYEGWARTNPKMLSALMQVGSSYKGKIGINEGFRTAEDQQRMVRERPGFAAKVGSSPHEKGKALDIDRGIINKTESLWSSAGFTRPMAREPWHLQLAAEGALVTKPTLTLMGEAGAELITPMNKIDHIMTSVIQKALSTAGKTALPSSEPMVSSMNALLAVQKEQLAVQQNILKAVQNQKQGGTSGGTAKSSDELSIMKWALPPM
jgi:hypothetical protein